MGNEKSKRGMGLLEIVVGLGILGIVAAGMSQMFSGSVKSQFRSSLTFSTDQLRRNLVAQVQNSKAWANTVADAANTSLTCLRTPMTPCTTTGTPTGTPLENQPIRLRDAQNNLVFDPLSSATAGFTASGSLCNTFSTTGNDACPIRFELTWTAVCTGSCIAPQVKVNGAMVYRPSSNSRTIAMNPENYSFNVVQGIMNSGAIILDGEFTNGVTIPFTLAQQGVLMANAVASFGWAAGAGGGSAVIDVQQDVGGTWTAIPTTGHCGSDSVVYSVPSTAVEGTTVCHLSLPPGDYRITGLEGHYAGTTVNYFHGRYTILAR